METIAPQVKKKRMSRKIVLTDEHFTAAITADQRRQLLASNAALVAQRLITVQEGAKLVIGGVTTVKDTPTEKDTLYVDLTTPENIPVIRLSSSSNGRFTVECRTKAITNRGKTDDYLHMSDSPTKFKYYDRLAKAAGRTRKTEGELVEMWSRLLDLSDVNSRKFHISVSVPSEVLLYLSDARDNPNKVADSIMESQVDKYVGEAKKLHVNLTTAVSNVKDFLHNPVWYIEPYPNVGVAVCQASYAGSTLNREDRVNVQITKPMVYASSFDTLPEDYRIPVMVRLKMLKAYVEGNAELAKRTRIYNMIPNADRFYDDVGVLTYSKATHSYRAPCAVLFA